MNRKVQTVLFFVSIAIVCWFWLQIHTSIIGEIVFLMFIADRSLPPRSSPIWLEKSWTPARQGLYRLPKHGTRYKLHLAYVSQQG